MQRNAQYLKVGSNVEEALKQIASELFLMRISIWVISWVLICMLFFKNMHGK